MCFSVCGGFLMALGAPRVVQETPRDAKSDQKTEKWTQMTPKVMPGRIFLEISETLIFDDSIMIFMVF